ncbi:MAG: hypothetical protein R3F23_05365 [Verrucomicrobiia bacterium]
MSAVDRAARMLARLARLRQRPKKYIDDKIFRDYLNGRFHHVPNVENVREVADGATKMGYLADGLSAEVSEKLPIMIRQLEASEITLKQFSKSMMSMCVRSRELDKTAKNLLSEFIAVNARAPNTIHPQLILEMRRAIEAIGNTREAIENAWFLLVQSNNPAIIPEFVKALERVSKNITEFEEAVAAVEQTALALEKSSKVGLASFLGGPFALQEKVESGESLDFWDAMRVLEAPSMPELLENAVSGRPVGILDVGLTSLELIENPLDPIMDVAIDSSLSALEVAKTPSTVAKSAAAMGKAVQEITEQVAEKPSVWKMAEGKASDTVLQLSPPPPSSIIIF